jgi:hypothetical protein
LLIFLVIFYYELLKNNFGLKINVNHVVNISQENKKIVLLTDPPTRQIIGWT